MKEKKTTSLTEVTMVNAHLVKRAYLQDGELKMHKNLLDFKKTKNGDLQCNFRLSTYAGYCKTVDINCTSFGDPANYMKMILDSGKDLKEMHFYAAGEIRAVPDEDRKYLKVTNIRRLDDAKTEAPKAPKTIPEEKKNQDKPAKKESTLPKAPIRRPLGEELNLDEEDPFEIV